MSLDAYAHYWSSARGLSDRKRRDRMRRIREKAGIDSGFGGAGDPLGAQTPMVQDQMLQQLARRASGENGRIDDWESLVDPTLSYGENLATILKNGGKELDSKIEEDRENWLDSAPDRQQRHAKEAIRENLDALESGEAPELREDIAAEFGEPFVEGAIAEARALEIPAEDVGAPEPAPEPAPTTPEPPAEPETPAGPEPPATGTEEPRPAAEGAGGFAPTLAAAAAVVGISRLSPARGVISGAKRSLRAVGRGLLLIVALLARGTILGARASATVAVWAVWLSVGAFVVIVSAIAMIAANPSHQRSRSA